MIQAASGLSAVPASHVRLISPRRISSSSSRKPSRICSSFAYDNVRSGGKGMNWYHELKLTVRGYELNSNGVVNDAVYASYCEFGQSELVDRIGFHNEGFAISECKFKFIAPLRKRDKFLLKVRIYDLYASRMFFEDLIFKLPNQEPILEAKSTVVWLNKDRRPARIPPFMISKFNQFLYLRN